MSKALTFLFTILLSHSAFSVPECRYGESGLPTILYVLVPSSNGLAVHDTAVLLGPRVFITTGHLLDRLQARGYLVYGGKRYHFSAYRNPKYDYATMNDSTYDITVGILDEALPNAESWAVGSPALLKNEPTHVAGCVHGNLREQEGLATTKTGGTIIVFTPHNEVLLGPGDGGGPLWLWDSEGKRRVIGMMVFLMGHQLGYTILSEENLDFIRQTALKNGLPSPVESVSFQ